MDIQETSIKKAMAAIRACLEVDSEYAFGWHANIKMCCYDAIRDTEIDMHNYQEFVTHEDALDIADDAASRFMKLCFGVDTSGNMLDDSKEQV